MRRTEEGADRVSTANNTDAATQLLQHVEQDIKRHLVLLHWIEQKRQVMHLVGNATASRNRGNTVVRREDNSLLHQQLRPQEVTKRQSRVRGPALANRARDCHEIWTEIEAVRTMGFGMTRLR